MIRLRKIERAASKVKFQCHTLSVMPNEASSAQELESPADFVDTLFTQRYLFCKCINIGL